MAALEKIVEGGFRALLLCSAVYFGAKYAPYVLRVADTVKQKIIPERYSASGPGGSALPPESLAAKDPRLYNAILIQRYVDVNGGSR